MRRLIFTIGAPGSGKTTLAQQLVAANPNMATVHLDGIRAAAFGSKRTFWDNVTSERESVVADLYYAQFEHLAAHTRFDIIVPNTNLRRNYYQHARAVGAAHDMQLIPVVFDHISLRELLDRNNMRPAEDRVPLQELLKYHNAFNSEGAYWQSIPDAILMSKVTSDIINILT